MVATDFSPATIQGQHYSFNGVYQIEILNLYELRICAPSLHINKNQNMSTNPKIVRPILREVYSLEIV